MKAAFKEQGVLTPREITAYLDRYVIGQKRAKEVVSIAAYNHYKRLHSPRVGSGKLIKKSNILLIGPTGCGKTHIARNLADVLGVPFTVVNATDYTEAGYYGKDVEVMVAELLFKTGGNVEETQKGIVFVDEVDKIARRSHGARSGSGSRDIGGEGVQQALLKLMEGEEVFVPLNVTQHWNRHDFVVVDVSDILFICAGTFSDLNRGRHSRVMGFRHGEDSEQGRDARSRITHRDLEEYGMLAEFLGRLPVLVEMNELGERELIQIMKEPPDSIIREYQEILSYDDIELEITDEALQQIARTAKSRGFGARGLKAIFEELFHDLMFHAPENRGSTIVIDPDFVRQRIGR